MMPQLASTNDRFLQWLLKNLDAVAVGDASYEGFPIDRETRVTQYKIAYSFVIMSCLHTSPYYVVGHNQTLIGAFVFTLGSLIFGWWGLPIGPIVTIQAVWGNLLGGSRQTVGDLVDDLTGHPRKVVMLTKEAAAHARQLIVDRAFPSDTALRISPINTQNPTYRIEFDCPDSDGRQWRGESQGLTILVDKRSAREMEGLIVDCEQGEFTFRKGSESLTG